MTITVIRHSIRNRGGDRLILDYCAYLVQKGHEVIYWTNEVNTHFPIDPRIQIKRIPLPGVVGTIFFSLIKKIKEDIVLVDLVVMAAFTALRNKKKVVYVAQDYDVSYYQSAVLQWLTDFFYKFVLHDLRIPTMSVSEGLSAQLSRYKPYRLMTVSNGVNADFFYRDPDSRFIKEKSKPNAILLFAREDYRKGLDVGIKTIEELMKIRPQQDWELWTIGTAKISLESNLIKTYGFLNSDADLRGILSACDIYLIPSRSEGLSLLLLQALACQCVIVSTAVSNIIRDGVNGLISPIEDGKGLARRISQVLDDAQLRQDLKKNARILAEQYSFSTSCTRFEKALTDCLQQG